MYTTIMTLKATAILGLAVIGILLSGCGVSASVYPIDRHEQMQSSERKPLKCYFINCDTNTREIKGS